MNITKTTTRRYSSATIARAGLRALHPSLAWALVRDIVGIRTRIRESQRHLEEAIGWICRATDRCGGRGVSLGYSVVHGWFPPYPETSGYIIPTLCDFAALTGDDSYRERALGLAEWESEIQLSSGAVMGGVYRGNCIGATPVAFNTGQVILGWVRAFKETANKRILDSATRAGDWLIAVQAPDGAWRLPGKETQTTVHAYDVRTAWSLLLLASVSDADRYRESAMRNLEWTMAQQQENGWFRENAFFAESSWNLPLTHTIAYVMEGLLESWKLTGDRRCYDACFKTAEKLLRIFELRRFMAGEFDELWKSKAKFSCLTGNVQIAGVWLQIFGHTGDSRFLSAALKLNDYVKSTQQLDSLHPGIRGGIKGSQPLFGRYTPFTYINWGAKFFADTMMLETSAVAEFEAAVLRGEHLGPGRFAMRKSTLEHM